VGKKKGKSSKAYVGRGQTKEVKERGVPITHRKKKGSEVKYISGRTCIEVLE